MFRRKKERERECTILQRNISHEGKDIFKIEILHFPRIAPQVHNRLTSLHRIHETFETYEKAVVAVSTAGEILIS